MEVLKHRVNKISDFNHDFGVEIDVRDHNGEIVLAHDFPNQNSLLLKNYLKKIPSKTLIAINVKSCGIENDLKNIISDFNLKNYFVFDFSFPYLLKAQKNGINCAFRLSEYERDIHKFCKWVWIDCFEKIWYDSELLKKLKDGNLKIAIVSPDIHGRENLEEISKIQEFAKENLIDAICTAKVDFWKND